MLSKLTPISTALLAAHLLLVGCERQPEQTESTKVDQAPAVIATAEISNPSDFARHDEHVYFSYYDLGLEAPTSALARSGSNLLPSQSIDIDADGEVDGLLVQIKLDAAASTSVEIVKGDAPTTRYEKRTQAEISHKVNGSWVPHTKTEGFQEYVGGEFENVQTLTPPPQYTDHSNWIRYEGPGIESDKVGYRIYLDWRNGFDVFGKTTAEPSLQLVGQDGYDSYHEMQDWGMDILKVGSSLGAGGFASWNGEQLEFVSDTSARTATVVNNGALFSSFQIDYQDWKRSLNTTNVNAHFSMQAGSRLVKVDIESDNALGPIGIGVVAHENTEFVQGSFDIPGDTYTYIGSWGQQSLAGDNLGLAVIFRNRTFDQLVDTNSSHVAVLETPGNLFDYYLVAAWEGEHGTDIKSKDAFVKFLEQEAEKLTIPLRVRLKTAASIQAKRELDPSKNALEWSKKLADSELERKALNYHYDGWDVNRRRPPKFEYDIVGWLPLTYHKLAEATGNSDYSNVLEHVTGSFIEDDGSIKRYSYDSFNIDAIAPGSAVLALYELTQNEKYKLAADLLRKQLEEHPKTSEGAFWHKKRYDHQLWLDGVFMGMPFLAQYSNMFENGHSIAEAVNEFVLTRKYLRDPKTGLYYHGWDEAKVQPWADKETGLSPEFWARGMGWLAMATVDILDFIPESDAELRAPILDMISEIAAALKLYQDYDTHTWWQVMDKPNAAGNYRESSASAMFTYFYAKAVNNGYLPESYLDVALRSYEGLINEFVLVHADGAISMTNQCYVAGLGFGRDGSYHYYMSEIVSKNDPKGTFPFILAGIEVNKLNK